MRHHVDGRVKPGRDGNILIFDGKMCVHAGRKGEGAAIFFTPLPMRRRGLGGMERWSRRRRRRGPEFVNG